MYIYVFKHLPLYAIVEKPRSSAEKTFGNLFALIYGCLKEGVFWIASFLDVDPNVSQLLLLSVSK